MTQEDDDAMDKIAAKSAAAADDTLAGREAALLKSTSVNLEALRPQISDQASFNQLIAAVNESTQRNESIAELQQRITNLGKGALAVAKQVAAIAAKAPII
jgi:hypothetical protein